MGQKLVGCAEALDMIGDGDVVGIGGGPLHGAPMALVRALIRAGRRHLTLVLTPRSGIAPDLLLGSGCARIIEFAQVTLDEYGMPPHFRRLAQAGAIECREHT